MPEILEDFRLIFASDAHAGVLHGDGDPTLVLIIRRSDRHGPGRRELQRIAEQIENNLLHLLAIA